MDEEIELTDRPIADGICSDIRYGRMINGRKFYVYVKFPDTVPWDDWISEDTNSKRNRISKLMHEIYFIMREP